MAENYGNKIPPILSATVYPITWWDRLTGRAPWIKLVNIRNANLELLEYNTNEELEILRQGVNDLQPEKVLKQEAKYLDEIGVLKARVKELEAELAARKAQTDDRERREREMQQQQKRRTFEPEPVLIKPERAQTLGRSIQGRGHVEPNSGAHATSGAIHSTPQDGGSGILMQAAVLHTILAADDAPARSEPAYCAPEPTRSEPSYSPTPDSPSSSDGGGGGCD